MKREMIGLILGMALVTFFLRFVPMALLTKWTIPKRVRLCLEYVPVSILSAFVFPIFFLDVKGTLLIQPRLLFAAVPVFVFAWKVRSVWGSVVSGMLIYWVLGFVYT
jgi:branched-subunit amino acid transport protein